ncbi:dihydroorotase [Jannaschia aquimarina]|uniref:Dihydroorotase n=1 Tax=Jannaschia aquimarina TaxID=935700 RepID=A0A0D1EGV5_9RHOB|nr:dihydroorotase [Jannaschia aquimarina]KIT16141.1 Dihydroorotase [Jannaschia aquimarina]SNT37231.1 dihydroorotase [Jannaschia aquimarina]
MESLTIRRPDDWHLHLRDGVMLDVVAPLSRHFGRAIVMPNLVPPVVTKAQAEAYRDRIRSAGFARPLMTLYLTETTDPQDVVAAHRDGVITAVKLYPAGATTNSASGVRDFEAVRPVLAAMEEYGVPLCLHGEVTAAEIDIFDREAAFLDQRLDPLRRAHPALKLTLEHVTTEEAVAYVCENGLGATITPQHLMSDRNDMLAGGMRPHFYCLPILKRRKHREALRRAATTRSEFFLGTDSAPHPQHAKEACVCAAGCFTAPHALALYATVFEEEGALDAFEAFASLNGPRHYGLPPNDDTITLVRDEALSLPDRHGDDPRVVPFDPGRPIHWHVQEQT